MYLPGLIIALLLLSSSARSQDNYVDTLPGKTPTPVTDFQLSDLDTTIDYDELFRDFEAFMDSILTPRSYTLVSLSQSIGFFNYLSKTSLYSIESRKQMVITPLVGYYHKNGLGITGTAYLTKNDNKSTFFQGSVSGTYDYLKNKNLATGISFSRFFTKKDLEFYTTPLQNELYGYFTYRKGWIRPAIAASYGWGNRSDFSEREELIEDLRLRRRGFTYINTKENISDFSVLASVRHDFYWLDVLGKKDFIRFTPQLTSTFGTQKFGFNQSSSTYITLLRNNTNVLYSAENLTLDENLNFQPLSLTLFLRGEYSIGKFFVQPQLAFDYFIPGDNKKVIALFSLNTGFIF